MNEEKKAIIKVDKNGYFRLPDFFNINYNEKIFYINGNIETRVYKENDMATVINMYMKMLENESDLTKRRKYKRKFYNSITDNIVNNNGIIKLPKYLLEKNLDYIYVIAYQKHLKIFANELEYEEYKSKFFPYKK